MKILTAKIVHNTQELHNIPTESDFKNSGKNLFTFRVFIFQKLF